MASRKQGVILSYVLMVFEVLSTLLLTPYMLRTLGQAEYGIYKLSLAFTAYLLLLDLGVGNAIIRFLAKYRVNNDRTSANKFLGVTTIFYIGIGILALIVGGILILIFPHLFAKGFTPEEIVLGQKLLVATTINVSVTLGTAAYTNALIAYEEFIVSRLASIIQIIIRVSLFYICLRRGMGSIGLVYVQLVTTLLCRSFFIYYVCSKIRLKPIFKNFDGTFVKEIALYSSLILIQMIATQLNASIGQLLLGMVVVSSSVLLGIYSIGTQVVQYYQTIGSAFSGVLMPGIVKLVEDKVPPQTLCNEMIRIGRIIIIVLAAILCAYIVCGCDFIILWVGQDNIMAWYISLILMAVYMILLAESVGNMILWAMNSHKEQSYAKLLIVMLNIIVSIFLIKWSPLLGATLGTAISLIVGDVVVMNVIFVKKIHIDILTYYKGLLSGILPSIILSVLAGMLIGFRLPVTWGYFIIKILATLIPYCICLLLFGMTQYEKDLIIVPIKKCINKYCRI